MYVTTLLGESKWRKSSIIESNWTLIEPQPLDNLLHNSRPLGTEHQILPWQNFHSSIETYLYSVTSSEDTPFEGVDRLKESA